MAVFDFLLDKKGLENQRDDAKQFAVERYDSNDLNEREVLARRRAEEGLYDSEQGQARQRTIDSLFRKSPNNLYGAGSGRQLAAQDARNRNRQNALSQFESNLTQADLQAKRQGENQYANVKTQQNQLESQRQAAFSEADMQYESALEQRRQQLKSTVGKLAGTAAGMAFGGPLGGSIGGAIGGGLLGGGSGALDGAAAGLQSGYMFQQSQPQSTGEGTDTYGNIMGQSGMGKTVANLPQSQAGGEQMAGGLPPVDTGFEFGPPQIGPAKDVSMYSVNSQNKTQAAMMDDPVRSTPAKPAQQPSIDSLLNQQQQYSSDGLFPYIEDMQGNPRRDRQANSAYGSFGVPMDLPDMKDTWNYLKTSDGRR